MGADMPEGLDSRTLNGCGPGRHAADVGDILRSCSNIGDALRAHQGPHASVGERWCKSIFIVDSIFEESVPTTWKATKPKPERQNSEFNHNE